MNLVLECDTFDKKNIFFHEPVKNTVMTDSNFIRIIYSNKDIVLNGIYIKLDINKSFLQKKYSFSKLHTNDSNDIVFGFIENLERRILEKYKSDNNKVYKMKDQISYLINKINNCNNDRVIFSYILKISGLWETQTDVGITHKFIYL